MYVCVCVQVGAYGRVWLAKLALSLYAFDGFDCSYASCFYVGRSVCAKTSPANSLDKLKFCRQLVAISLALPPSLPSLSLSLCFFPLHSFGRCLPKVVQHFVPWFKLLSHKLIQCRCLYFLLPSLSLSVSLCPSLSPSSYTVCQKFNLR